MKLMQMLHSRCCFHNLYPKRTCPYLCIWKCTCGFILYTFPLWEVTPYCPPSALGSLLYILVFIFTWWKVIIVWLIQAPVVIVVSSRGPCLFVDIKTLIQRNDCLIVEFQIRVGPILGHRISHIFLKSHCVTSRHNLAALVRPSCPAFFKQGGGSVALFK